jgi:hypothetical protein
VADLRSGKELEIEAEHDVGLVFVEAKVNGYLSITARLRCRGDHAASKAVAAFEFIKAQLTGEKPNLPRIAKRR